MANQTLTGKVIHRSLDDLSLVIPLHESFAIINLALWLTAQTDKDGNTLPHTNSSVDLKDIKLITENKSNEVHLSYYLATSASTVTVLFEKDVDNILDNFVAVGDSLNSVSSTNFSKLIELHNLTEDHIEIYFRICNNIPFINCKEAKFDWKHSAYALFKVFVEEKLLINITEDFVIHTAKSVKRLGTFDNKLKQQLEIEKEIAPYFSNRKSKSNECLIGMLTFKSGKVLIEDNNTSISLHIETDQNSDVLQFYNSLVVVLQYHSIGEIYYDGVAECLFTDIKNIKLLCSIGIGSQLFPSVQCKKLALASEFEDINRDFHNDEFEIEAISSVRKVYSRNELEVWLKLKQGTDSGKKCLLALRGDYLPIVCGLDVGRSYVLHTQTIIERAEKNPHIQRISDAQPCFKLHRPGSYFVPQQLNNPIETFTAISHLSPKKTIMINIRAKVLEHYLNTTDTCRKIPESSHRLGMLAAKFEHRLELLFDDNTRKSLYLSHWEEKQTPEGLHPKVILSVTQASYNGRYFSANIFTRIQVVGTGNELNKYVTANVNPETRENIEYQSVKTCAFKHYTFVRCKVYVFKCNGRANFLSKDMSLTEIYMEQILKLSMASKLNNAAVRKEAKTQSAAFYSRASTRENGAAEKRILKLPVESNKRTVVRDNQGKTSLQCTKFQLLYKLMEIYNEDEIKEYQNVSYKEDVYFGYINDIVMNEDVKKYLPFFHLWIQHVNCKLRSGIKCMDILCKKELNNSWTIQDIFSVNSV